MSAKPYAGAPVSRIFRERWLSGQQIGPTRPVGLVEVRRGRFVHSQHKFPGLGYPTFGEFPGCLGVGFWYPDWQVNSDWVALDGVQNIRLEQSFDNNGVTSCTIVMDNLAYVEHTGHAGMLYHTIEDGYYSPLRGFVGKNRPDPGVTKTPFFNKLPNAQIRVRQGYGIDSLVTTFLGLIDDVDTGSLPNQITLTARDFGGVLVDQHVFGWAKERDLPSPLTFAPRSIAENSKLVGGGYEASSSESGHPASEAGDNDKVGWRSAVRSNPDDTEWIEFRIPKGKYSNLYINVPFDNMHCYVGIKPTGYSSGKPPQFNGQNISHQLDGRGFWNPDHQQVPGSIDGGWSYFSEIPATKSGGHWISLLGEFYIGDDTVLRFGFRNLGAVDGGYQARVVRIRANWRSFSKDAKTGRYVLIDDVSDIIRCVLRWTGFKGWEIEDTGTNLQEVYVADPSQSMMDLINMVKDMTGYTFFIGEPRDDSNDQDLGYPIFRNNRVMENVTAPTEFIDDKLLLTDAKVKISNKDDHCIIRCRGIDKKNGVTLDGDQITRLMFAYIPPWAGEQAAKQAGVLKPITHTDEKLVNMADVEFGCYLIAIQIALLKYTTVLSLPCNPGIGLDTLQSVIEREQGLNSRVYIASRTQEMQFGSDGFWTMELGGSLADTPDISGVLDDYNAAIKRLDRGQHNPFLRKRKGKVLAYGYED